MKSESTPSSNAKHGICQIAYIGLGANLSQPKKQLELAIASLAELTNCTLVQVSSFYLSEPLGPPTQPHYINAVVALRTTLEPLILLDKLQQIENQQGRVRTSQKWQARTLDLDMLLYGNLRIEHSRLIVPHSGVKLRNFVLLPLFEIAPQLVLPDGDSVATLAAAIDSTGIEKL